MHQPTSQPERLRHFSCSLFGHLQLCSEKVSVAVMWLLFSLIDLSSADYEQQKFLRDSPLYLLLVYAIDHKQALFPRKKLLLL